MPVQDRATATHARILRAASQLFLDRHFADVTIDKVAAAAQVTKGAVYHHFSSKEELYLVMLLTDLKQKQKLFAQSVASSGSCRDRLTSLTRAYFNLSNSERQLITLVRRDINLFDGEIREQLVRAYQAALPEQVELILISGMQNDEITPADPRLLSWSFVALVEVSLSPHAGRIFPGPEAKIDHVINLFLDGASLHRG